MAILHIEGFEGFSGSNQGLNDTQLTRKYPNSTLSNSSLNFATGHNSNTSLRFGRIGAHDLLNFDVPTDNEFYVSLSFRYHDNFPGSTGSRLIQYVNSGTIQNTIGVYSDGSIKIKRSATATLETTAADVVSVDTWHQMEIHQVCGDSGSWEVRLDGVTVLSGTGDIQGDTVSDITNILVWGWASNAADLLGITEVDNIVMQDSAGSFIDGEWYIEGLLPNAAGDLSDLTPASGSNHENVDEVPADDDTSYVESATNGNQDLYNYQNLTPLESGSSIVAAQINTVVKQSAGEDLITLIKSGGTVYQDIAQIVDSAYVSLSRLEALDPDTLASWTESGINAAQFGVEVSV